MKRTRKSVGGATTSSPGTEPDTRAGAHESLTTIAEATARYPGEWVLIRVAARDVNVVPTQGYLIDHDPCLERMREVETRCADSSDSHYLFPTFPYLCSGAEARVWLEQLDRHFTGEPFRLTLREA
jgi:hypothetical protein